MDTDGTGLAATGLAKSAPALAEPALAALTPVPDDAVPAETGEPVEPDMPVFHRMWSSPTPPASSQ
jgi:hypothetical protein